MGEIERSRLLADIGRTYARFALETAPGALEHIALLRCSEHADFEGAVRAYLRRLPPLPAPARHAAAAIANRVEGDRVRAASGHWQFSIDEMRTRLGLETLVVVNDFTTLAMALPRLGAHDCRQVGAGTPRAQAVAGLIGPGSGLGMSGLIPSAQGPISLGSEGGHATFSPRDERERDILQFASREHPHVSFECLVSESGLELIHQALAERAGKAARSCASEEILLRAIDGSDALCTEALEAFCAMLGTAAANLALTLGALGGIYIGGTVVPRLGTWFDRSPFRARFEDHGRFGAYLAAIPTHVITSENATFVGLSAILAAQLRSRARSGDGVGVIDQVRRARSRLSPAERRVADRVLAQPRAVLGDPIAGIARTANVSQPTVIRFCRSLGCEGLSDFKLRLASSLAGTVPLAHAQVTHEDDTLEIGAKVLGNTASAILQVRDRLNRDMIARAVALLASAPRVQLHAAGPYGTVALDAQFKFLRLGVPCAAYAEPRLQLLAAGVLQAGDVAVVISGGGRAPDLVDVVEKVRMRGGTVVAITASQSPLARKADLALIIDHGEDASTHVPMISRILHLLVIDILAVGLALRRKDAAGAFGVLAAAQETVLVTQPGR